MDKFVNTQLSTPFENLIREQYIDNTTFWFHGSKEVQTVQFRSPVIRYD